MLHDDNTASQTFELYGPKNYSTAEIAELVDREIYKKRRHINIPKAIFKPLGGIVNKLLWWPLIPSAEEIEREFHDQVIDDTAKTFKDLGITPGELANYTYHYLVSFEPQSPCYWTLILTPQKQGYRSDAYYDLPPSTEKERREEKQYLHVLDDQ